MYQVIKVIAAKMKAIFVIFVGFFSKNDANTVPSF